MKHFLILIFFSLITFNNIKSQSLPAHGIYHFTKCDYSTCNANFWRVIGTADKESQKIIMTMIPFDKQNRPIQDKVVRNGEYVSSTLDSMDIEVEIDGEKKILKFSQYKIVY